MDTDKAKEQIKRAISDIDEIQTNELTPDEITDNLRCAMYHLRAARQALSFK